MNAARLLYRTRQFWLTLRPTTRLDLSQAASILTTQQLALFRRMQPSEQVHCLRVLQRVIESGDVDRDLCVAALLHDIGKIRLPLRPWERVLIVLVQGLCPQCVHRWGALSGDDIGAAPAWRRAFILAENHPRWGAEYAAASGASPLTVALIRRHQERLPIDPGPDESREDMLLRHLQTVDDNS